MINRRKFISSSAAAAASLLVSRAGKTNPVDPIGRYGPILRRERFTSPIVIEKMDLVRVADNWFVHVRSTDGAEGWAISHNRSLPLSQGIFTQLVAPFMVGRDARDLESLVDDVYLHGSNYKLQGQSFWVPVASAEFAILDLLGRIAGVSAAELLGERLRESIPLYIANNHRHLGPADSLARIVESVDRIDARAVKFKLGGRMKNRDRIPGRTEALIPMVADALGDRCTLYADANSSYVDVAEAIRIGRLLEHHGFAFYEEPCPFDYLEETKRVADALDIPIAWGEQESSQWRFKWMIDQGGVQIPQPDLFYYGGLIRSLRVARMAEARGLDCTPHISGYGLGFLYMGIYATCCPNPGAFQEYKGINRDFPWMSNGPEFSIVDGAMTAPGGIGLGVDIDPDYLETGSLIT
ncbi:MAG: enolase C-terminal domain-like protein [Synoicihabitans sp.]